MSRSTKKTKKPYNFNMPSAKPLRIARPISLPRLSHLPSVTLTSYEDRRTYHPEPYTRVAFALPRSAAQLVAGPHRNVNKPSRSSGQTHPGASGQSARLPASISFKIPSRVALCVRRHRRKEVLFAHNKAGGSVSRFKPRKLSKYSQIGC